MGIKRAYDDISTIKSIQQGRYAQNRTDAQLERMGAEQPTCVGYSEIDKYAIESYKKHFPEHKNYGDITKLIAKDIPDFDCLVGGFPCQAFSIAGQRKGFDDTRGTLFFDIARILQEKQPRLVVLENVKGILSHDKGNTFVTIVSTLDELGYNVEWQVLNSKNFGVPQNRERVFIIGHSRNEGGRQIFPLGEDTSKLSKEQIQKLRGSGTRPIWKVGDSEKSRREILRSYKIRRLTPIECERLQGFPDNWTVGSDSQRYKQCGNAVTVNVIEAIFKELIWKMN